MGHSPISKLARYDVSLMTDREWRHSVGKRWSQSSGATELRDKCPVSFQEYSQLEATDWTLFQDALATINKDVPRTSWSCLHEPTWQELLRQRETEVGADEWQSTLRRVCVAFVRREGRGDHRACRGYTQGMTQMAAILLLFVDEAADAFWLLVALVERIAPRDLYSEPPAALAGTAGEAGVVKALLARLPASRGEDADDLSRTAEMLAVKMAVPLLVDCTEASVTVALWDTVFVDCTFDLVACAVAATIEVVARERRTQSPLEDEQDAESLLCATLRKLSTLSKPMPTVDDIEAVASVLTVEQIASTRAETREAIADSWEHRLQDLSELGFTTPQLKQLRDEFAKQSKGSSRLTTAQFLDLVSSTGLPLTAAATTRVLELVDADDDGSFDFREVTCCLSSLSAGSMTQRLAFMFAVSNILIRCPTVFRHLRHVLGL